jgi:hypothetical protein
MDAISVDDPSVVGETGAAGVGIMEELGEIRVACTLALKPTMAAAAAVIFIHLFFIYFLFVSWFVFGV